MNQPSSDRPVVLVHGLATSAQRTWVETGWVDLLRDAGREVIALDLPGHGGTPGLDDWSSLERWVAAQLPDGPLDAVGFSLGARTLLVVASWEPDRFERLVVAGVGANLFRQDGSSEQLASDLADVGEETHPLARHFLALAESSGTDPEAVRALLSTPRAPLGDDALRSIRSDVLVALGTEDFAGPADPLMERLPTARLVELRGVDHFATPKSMAFLDAGLTHLGAA